MCRKGIIVYALWGISFCFPYYIWWSIQNTSTSNNILFDHSVVCTPPSPHAYLRRVFADNADDGCVWQKARISRPLSLISRMSHKVASLQQLGSGSKLKRSIQAASCSFHLHFLFPHQHHLPQSWLNWPSRPYIYRSQTLRWRSCRKLACKFEMQVIVSVL